uniref:Uncharacterized protein LOC101496062 n=1 Tax=Cicer arietinum TaxID=3827 RepID=A0A3Q7YEH6_CICAR|nr:uncharacterized protein LOC101496062 [Cicer arietinum]
MKVFSLLRKNEMFFLLRILFLVKLFTMKSGLLFRTKMVQKMSIEFGTLSDRSWHLLNCKFVCFEIFVLSNLIRICYYVYVDHSCVIFSNVAQPDQVWLNMMLYYFTVYFFCYASWQFVQDLLHCFHVLNPILYDNFHFKVCFGYYISAYDELLGFPFKTSWMM